MPNALQITDPNADNPLAQAPSWADAYGSLAGTGSGGVDALGQWLAAQRAKQQRPPMWPMSNAVGTETTQQPQQLTMPTPGVQPVAFWGGQPVSQQFYDMGHQAQANALGWVGSAGPGGPIRAFHGSPYDFERFDTSKIGTGEGAQAYGHGLYFAEGENVARSYRDALTDRSDRPLVGSDVKLPNWVANHIEAGGDPQAVRDEFANRIQDMQKGIDTGTDNQPWVTQGNIEGLQRINSALDDMKAGKVSLGPKGRMYEVNIGADPEQFLHWDKPLSEQSPFVNDAVRKAGLVDPKPTVEWQGDPALWELHQNGRPTGTMLEDAGDGRTYNEIINGKLTGSIPNGAVDAWKDMHAQSLRDAYRDPDPTGRDLIKNNPGIERELHTIGLPGIRYLDQGSRGAGQGTHNYVVFDAATIDILRKYGLAGLGIGLGSAAATRQQPEQ